MFSVVFPLRPAYFLALFEQGVEGRRRHPLARRLLADQREQLVGEVGAVVREPPFALGVAAFQGAQIAQHLSRRVAVAQRVLYDALDGQRHVAGEEVCPYPLRRPDVDGAGFELGLRDLERLLDAPQLPVGVDDAGGLPAGLGGDYAVVAVAGGVRLHGLEVQLGCPPYDLAGLGVEVDVLHVLRGAEVRGPGVPAGAGDQLAGLLEDGLPLVARPLGVLARPEGHGEHGHLHLVPPRRRASRPPQP